MRFQIPKNIVDAPTANAEETRVVEAELRNKQARCWKDANVPEKYRRADFGMIGSLPPDVSEPYAKTISSLQHLLEQPAMLAMIGGRGAGKTWMACALVREFCKAGRSAMYLEAMDYFLELQETFDNGCKINSASVERKHIAPELIVLDAMEERADTAWNDRMLVRLINKRYAANKSTLMISNQDATTFKKHIGESIEDRIRDGGGIIKCDWKSLRGRINP